jgi:ABC-2 type transport system ATP-binding protein
VSIPVDARTGRLRDALQALDAAGADVDDVSLRPPKLDEVFLALTGKALGHPTDRSPADGTAA